MSAELFWWSYLLVTLGFGVPYSVATFKLTDPESFKVSDYIMVSIMASLLWPIVVGYNLTHRQEIRDEKRKRIHKRNAKLLEVQLENHKTAMRERKARHAVALDEFMKQLPMKEYQWPVETRPKQRFGSPQEFGSPQDRFIERTLQVTPIHYKHGPCEMRTGQLDFLETITEESVTCPLCSKWMEKFDGY